MQRVATFMRVKPGREEQYRAEHRNIWPEVVDGITRFGIRNYSIFMQGRELYSYFEVEDLDKAMAMATADPDNQRWQTHMADFFDVGPGVKAGTTVHPAEVFYTEGYQGASVPMQRVATLMKVKQGLEDAYKTAHQEIWPEILAGIARVKIRNYSIFMIGRILFSYLEVADLDKAMARLSTDPDNRRWQKHMAHMFDIGPGIAEGTTVYLEEVFHVD